MAASASAMIVIAMADDPGLRGGDRGHRGGIGRQVRLPQPHRPREPADEQRPHRPHAPQMKIAEIGVQRRVGMHRQIPRLQRRIVRHLGNAGHRHPRRGLRIGSLRRAAHQDRAARLGAQDAACARTGSTAAATATDPARRPASPARRTAGRHPPPSPACRTAPRAAACGPRNRCHPAIQVVCHFLFTSRPRCATIGCKGASSGEPPEACPRRTSPP